MLKPVLSTKKTTKISGLITLCIYGISLYISISVYTISPFEIRKYLAGILLFESWGTLEVCSQKKNTMDFKVPGPLTLTRLRDKEHPCGKWNANSELMQRTAEVEE